MISRKSLNSNSRQRLALKPKLDPERSLWHWFFLFEVIHALKRQLQLKHEKNASSKKRKETAESILSTETNLTTSSDEGENKSTYLLLLITLVLAKLR
jgi:hypothetical protein